MKKLTINRVADANLRINRKAYINLFIGILVAVFLATATSLCAWGTVRGHEEQMAQRVGWMDMFMLGSDEGARRGGEPLRGLRRRPSARLLGAGGAA